MHLEDKLETRNPKPETNFPNTKHPTPNTYSIGIKLAIIFSISAP
jgi:hypothetical protein